MKGFAPTEQSIQTQGKTTDCDLDSKMNGSFKTYNAQVDTAKRFLWYYWWETVSSCFSYLQQRTTSKVIGAQTCTELALPNSALNTNILTRYKHLRRGKDEGIENEVGEHYLLKTCEVGAQGLHFSNFSHNTSVLLTKYVLGNTAKTWSQAILKI